MDGRMDGRTEELTNRMDENYIPLQHTSYAGSIITICLPLGRGANIIFHNAMKS